MSSDAQNNGHQGKVKSAQAEREERILKFWQDQEIFQKSLEKTKGAKEFIFYEGPPTANGRPGIHHLEARAFKDAIPRYKTMRGFHVRRKGGWDTHGLPVELQVEKELGLKSKKEIEKYGIAAFNHKCRESVWTYVHEWEQFTDRMGYWIDLKHPYITYKPHYIESVWQVIKKIDEEKLLYKDYKVVPWCPRCGTGLSSHELAQGYEVVKDLSVYVRFKVKNPEKIGLNGVVFILAWTTTPWTLPGNVALAVGEKIEYVQVDLKEAGERLILAKERLVALKDARYEITGTFRGRDLYGLEYEPLYPFLKDNIGDSEKEKLERAFKVYGADFVTTEDGTGIVHTAVMYGQDDFELGTRVGLPKYHLVNEDGTFKKEAGFLAGSFVKDPNTEVSIIKDLAGRGLLFGKEKIEHSYPFCWRCHTPLIYFARDSWYVRMSSLRHKLVKENEKIHWEPEHIKEGRFGEWLREVKDWAISRERYWGTPLPAWVCEKCQRYRIAGSIVDIAGEPRNTYHIMRHGEAENNINGVLNSDPKTVFKLTEKGREQVRASAKLFKKKPDLIVSSPFERTRETSEIFADAVGYPREKIIYDERLSEISFGELNGQHKDGYSMLFPNRKDYFALSAKGVENRHTIKRRVGSLLEELESQHQGRNILIVSHDGPLWMIGAMAEGLDIEQTLVLKPQGQPFLNNAEIKRLEYRILPHNEDFELDLHRPYIDQTKLTCVCGGEMSRVKEVMDVWFDSGSMPFAQDHYPFENKKYLEKSGYPADYISEAIDQTRGWFYTLHAIGVLMGQGRAFNNVICLGHILDAQGKKMSKSLGNVVSPWEMMDKYGADALRFWMYSVNQPGDSKNFEEKTVDEIVKKVFNLAANVLSFYKMYEKEAGGQKSKIDRVDSDHVLDRWIISRLDQLIVTTTRGLDNYIFLEPTRALRDFVSDLSQWYLRRSRDRFKGVDPKDKQSALLTSEYVLLTLAKIMAPYAPFFAEYIYREMGGPLESVHLESWPEAGKIDDELIKDMEEARQLASKGLDARMSAKINVRQPLKRLTVKLKVKDVGFDELGQELIQIVKDEVNIKEIVYDASIEAEVELDTILTSELKNEGQVRELLRRIQDLRKEKGLTVKDSAVLIATEDLKELIASNEMQIKNATNISNIEFGADFDLKL